MIKVSQCPSCSSERISIKKEYKFVKPEYENYTDCSTYTQRRLWILFKHILSGEDSLVFTMCHCENCDLMFSNPRFQEDEIEKKYKFLVDISSTIDEYKSKPLLYVEKRAQRIFDLIDGFSHDFKLTKKIEIADVGGQFGNNLSKFSPSRWNKNIIDYEKYNLYDDIDYIYPDWDNIQNKFDVIITNHTVEHMSFPFESLSKIIEKLRNDGILYIEVPLGAFREAYNVKEPLTHFNFYSEKSILNLIIELGLNPLYLNTSYQWVTDHAEYCLNIVAMKTAQSSYCGRVQSSKDVKYKPSYYLPLILKKLIGTDLFAK